MKKKKKNLSKPSVPTCTAHSFNVKFYEVFPKFDHSPGSGDGWQRFALEFPVELPFQSRNLETSPTWLYAICCLSTDRIIVKNLYVLRLEMKTYP
jgi:hypothetical protein